VQTQQAASLHIGAFEEAGEATGLALVPATLMRIAAAEIEGMHAGLFEH
jgi:hypothetical protein